MTHLVGAEATRSARNGGAVPDGASAAQAFRCFLKNAMQRFQASAAAAAL